MSASEIYAKKKRTFGDFRICWNGELANPNDVLKFIETNIPNWLAKDTPSIWIRLKRKDLDHLNFFLSHGFKMHRIKNENTIVLNRWLREREYTLPPSPFCYIGVGAVCFNKEGKILAVRENYKTKPGPWKFPGGLYDTKKDKKLSDAVIRECFEETGIRVHFDHLINARITMNSSLFHQMDIYISCKVIPDTEEIKFDPVEIFDCKWITPEELLSNSTQITKIMLSDASKHENGYIEVPSIHDWTMYQLE